MGVIIKIDQRKKEAKALIAYLRSLSFVDFVDLEETPRYNTETEKAIKEARAGKGIVKTKSHEDLMKKLRS